MSLSRRLFAACTLVLFSAAIPAAYSQILYGSLVGNVKDASDAVVAGASVTVTNAATNQSRQAQTNETGSYSLSTLEPGTYTVRVSKAGFSNFSESNVVVTINNVTRVDVKLALGAVTETVSVTGQTAALQTDRSEVRAEVTSTSLENLPVAPGRNYQQLFRTIPGFRPPSNAHSVPTNPARALTFNVNGVSYSINNTRIDGAASNSPWLPHISAFVPTLEAIETVNVVTNSFDAEQGLAGGAAVNVQIRGGTNSLHGALFESHADNHLKAKPFFLPAGQDIPKLVNNEFGGAIGGPIKRDKLFFFVSYEGNLDRELATRFGTVPTARIKAGDMSDSTRPIYDPDTGDANGANRTPFTNNLVPANRQSTIARKLADLTPLPNLDGFSNNYYAATSYIYDRHRADTKVNWNIMPKWTAFGRFSINHYDMINPEMFGKVGGPAISTAGSNAGIGTGNTFSFTGATTYVFTPRFVLDANVGWTRMDTSVEQSRLDENLGRDFLGIPGANGTRRFEGGWPTFAVSSYTNLGVNDNFMPYYRADPQYSIVANFNWTRGAHEIRFGTELYFTGMNQLQPEATANLYGAQGGFGFGTGPTQTVGGPSGNQFNSYATFLLGLATDAGKVLLTPEDGYTTRQKNYAVYIRDRWNVTSKLTLSYGVRWEYYPFPTRADRGLEWYDGSVNKMLVCGVGNVPNDCGVHVSKKLFAPRLGIAYRATPTLVVRAGYGITYDPFSLQRPLRTNYPILLIQNLTAPTSLAWTTTLASGLPAIQAPPLGNGVLDIPGTFAVTTTPKDFNRGYIQSWNFTVQKQLPGDFTVGAGYVATRSVRQLGYLDANSGQVIGAGNAGRPLQAKFGRSAATTLVTPLGTTHYDSLQATMQRRFHRGLQIEASYTWSKVIGLAINSDSGPNFVQALQYFNMNRVVADYDRTHMLHISQIWELPFGTGHTMASHGVPAALLGGWQVNQLWSFYTGSPFSVSASGTSLNLPNSSQRADQVKPSVQILGNAGRGMWYFDPLAFAPVTEPRFGTAGYRSLRGPGIVDWDFGVHRTFKITERVQMQLKAEVFNLTNTPHFANPAGNVSNMDVSGGVVRTNGFAEITGVTNLARDGIDERQFRLGLRLHF
jgi:carboxypeptidase family protein/TonB-dependent receptor-like protein